MKRLISIVCTLSILLGIVSVGFTANAATSSKSETSAASGTCGTGISWKVSKKLDGAASTDGTILTIYRTSTNDTVNREMTNYDSSDTNRPPYYSAYRKQIKKIIVKSGISKIGDRAFWGFSEATSIDMGNNVENIGTAAFSNMDSLTTINTNSNQYFTTSNGALFWKSGDNAKHDLVRYYGSGQSTYTIPSGVITVRAWAFYGNSTLSTINQEDTPTVTAINTKAFANCDKLKNVYIKNNCITLGGNLCEGSYKLNVLRIPPSVTNINGYTESASTTDKNNASLFGTNPDMSLYTNNLNISCANNSVAKSYADYKKITTQNYTWSFTLTLDANGGTNSSNTKSVKVDYGSTYSGLPTATNMTKTNCAFDGWWTSATGGTKISNGNLVKIAKSTTLYAHWTTSGGTITIYPYAQFDSLSNSLENYTKGVDYTSYIGELNTPPVPDGYEGYEFGGWYAYYKDGTVKEIDPKTTIFTEENGPFYLSAYWNGKPIDVSFDSNAGNDTVSGLSQKVQRNYQDTYGDLPTLSRFGYTFEGWYTTATDTDGKKGELIESSSKVNSTSDITLFARWSPITYYVALNRNNDTTDSSTINTAGLSNILTKYRKTDTNHEHPIYCIKVNYGEKYTTLPTVTRNGSTFSGWYSTSNGGTQISSNKGKNNSNILLTKDSANFNDMITYEDGTTGPQIYAGWNFTNVEITLVLQDGKITNNEFTTTGYSFTYDSTYSGLPTEAYVTKDGYNFNGWWTATTGGTKIENGNTVNLTGDNIYLYARWEAKEYTVTLNKDNGEENSTIKVTYDGKFTNLPTADDMTKTGYTFDAWYDENGNKVTNNTKVTDSAENLTLTAHWNPINYYINLYLGDHATIVDENNKPLNKNNITNMYPLYVTYGENILDTLSSLTVNCDTGYMIENTTWKYSETASSSSSTTIGNDDKFVGDNVINGNMTLVANVVASTYKVTLYDSSNLIGTVTFTYNQTYGEGVLDDGTTLKDYTEQNYNNSSFSGWYDENGDKINLDSDTVGEIEKNTRLYAKDKVKLDANGGVISSTGDSTKEIIISNNSVFNKVVSITNEETKAYKDSNYAFVGWNTKADGTGNTVSTTTTYTRGDEELTLYAMYKHTGTSLTLETYGGDCDNNYYDIQFNSDNGYTSGKYGDDITKLTATKTGYKFIGWSTKENEDGTNGLKVDENNTSLLIKKDSVYNASDIDTIKTLYAVYEPKNVTVNYSYPDDATCTTDNILAFESQTFDENYKLPVMQREGYTFAGWYDGDTEVTNNTKVTTATIHTLTSKWTALTYDVTLEADTGYFDKETKENSRVIKVTYDRGYGEGTYNDVALTNNELPTPTKDNYVFEGWYTKPNGEGIKITSMGAVKITANTTLYANYVGATNYINIDKNGGAFATSQISVSYGKAIGNDTIFDPSQAPTKTNYKFIGWFTKAEGGEQVTTDTIYNDTSLKTIYAHYIKLVSETTNLSISIKSATSVNLKWDKQDDISYYEVITLIGNSIVSKKQTTTNSITLNKLSSNKAYKFKVRAIASVDDNIVEGEYSSTVSRAKTYVAKPTLKVKSKKYKKTYIKITWKKVSNAKGYLVSQKKANGKYKKAKSTTSTTILVPITKSKTYTLKVRAYTKVLGKTFYSKYAKIAVKIKK